MRSLLAALLALVVLLAVAAADLAHYYPLLPDRIAVHFGPSGAGNQWQSKADYFGGMLQWGWFPPLVILGSGLLSAFLILFLPGAVQLPNKDYWTAPEHRVAAASLVLGYLTWFLVLLLALFLALTHLTFVANLGPAPAIGTGSTVLLLVGFLAAVVAWLVLFMRQLYFPPGRHRKRR
jgi:serine/threonine-protein kinase